MSSKRDFLLLVLMLAVITALHYFTAHYRLQLHEFYRRLYYLPIIYGAFRFRFRGGVLVSCVAATLYAPHLLFYVGNLRWEILNQLMEIILFLVVGVVTGTLTEGQRRQQSLVEQHLERITNLENYTHNVLQSMANGLAALDTNLRVTVYNDRLGSWLDWKGDVRGRPFFEIFPGGDNLETIFRQVLKSGEGLGGLEFTVPVRKGILPLRMFVQPLFTPGRIIFGLVVIFEDLREIRDLEEQVHRAERLSAVGVMASGIAHEIRNPLGIIKTISENIRAEDCSLQPGIQQGLEIIEEEISRANRVISELLNFARPIPYQWGQVDVGELVDDIVQTVRALATKNDVELSIKGSAGSLRADREKMKQALLNLVLNGIQAQPQGGRVEIHMAEQSDGIVIQIQDQGPGIDSEIADKIFDPFFSRREGGTGLGLAVVHRIIQEHGGKIKVESRQGYGTAFKLDLPKAGEGDGICGNSDSR